MIALMIVRTKPESAEWSGEQPDVLDELQHARTNLAAEWYEIRFSKDGCKRLKLITLDSWEALDDYLRDPVILKGMFIKNSTLLSSGGRIEYSAEEVSDWDAFVQSLLTSYPNNTEGLQCERIPRQDPSKRSLGRI